MILLFWISAPKHNRRCSCKILQEHLLLCFGFTKHKRRSSIYVLKEVLLNRSRWLGSKYVSTCIAKVSLFIAVTRKSYIHMNIELLWLYQVIWYQAFFSTFSDLEVLTYRRLHKYVLQVFKKILLLIYLKKG